jgi:hypothetical protein
VTESRRARGTRWNAAGSHSAMRFCQYVLILGALPRVLCSESRFEGALYHHSMDAGALFLLLRPSNSGGKGAIRPLRRYIFPRTDHTSCAVLKAPIENRTPCPLRDVGDPRNAAPTRC